MKPTQHDQCLEDYLKPYRTRFSYLLNRKLDPELSNFSNIIITKQISMDEVEPTSACFDIFDLNVLLLIIPFKIVGVSEFFNYTTLTIELEGN